MLGTGVADRGEAEGANDDSPTVAPEQDDTANPATADMAEARAVGALAVAAEAAAIEAATGAAPDAQGDASAVIDARAAFEARAAAEALTQALFDWRSYAALYPDLRDSGFPNPSRDLRDHFTVYGQHEGRAPSILFDIGYVRHRLAKYEDTDVPAALAFAHFARLPPDRRFVPNRWFSPWAVRQLYAERYP